jgi:tetratricopeptide (TPR) repeat protein
VSRKNAAAAAVELAVVRLEAKQAAEAERLARRAIDLHPDSPAALVALGRALAALGRVDEAVSAFDSAPAALSRLERSGAGADEARRAREFVQAATLWKLDALYRDGVRLMSQDPAQARRRFEATIQAAPKSQHARNARVQLSQLPPEPAPPGGLPGLPGGFPLPPGLIPDPANLPGGTGGLNPPPDWDFGYRQPR